jgi:uncharacterized integral membrane protein
VNVLGRYLWLIVLVPLAVLLIAFAVANRHVVQLSFDPMNAANPAVAIDLPMFVYIFGAIAFGLVLGGAGTWFTQGKYRKLARDRRQEAAKWKFEAEKQVEKNKVERFQDTANGNSTFPVLPSSKVA